MILRVTVPVTMSFSWTVSMTFIQASIFSALRLLSAIMPRDSSMPAVDVFDVFDQHLDDVWPTSGGSSPSSHSLRGIGAFALVADVDQHEVAVDAENRAPRRSS